MPIENPGILKGNPEEKHFNWLNAQLLHWCCPVVAGTASMHSKEQSDKKKTFFSIEDFLSSEKPTKKQKQIDRKNKKSLCDASHMVPGEDATD